MIDRVASWIRAAGRVAVLTGAGISAESGVPVFRGAGGLWREHRPEDLATPAAFARRPAFVWDWYLWRRERIAQARPNAGHQVIARLQQDRPRVTLVTQNVDGLHDRAGCPPDVELHGNLWRVRCANGCGYAGRDGESDPARTELRCACGGWLRPDVIWFGEPLDLDGLARAAESVEAADVVLVVGTSGVVYPAAALPRRAGRGAGGRRDAKLVEINIETTALSAEAHAVLRGPAADVLAALEQRL